MCRVLMAMLSPVKSSNPFIFTSSGMVKRHIYILDHVLSPMVGWEGFDGPDYPSRDHVSGADSVRAYLCVEFEDHLLQCFSLP